MKRPQKAFFEKNELHCNYVYTKFRKNRNFADFCKKVLLYDNLSVSDLYTQCSLGGSERSNIYQ